ncbi:MAG TPA: Arc family DNA-binding protein [Thermoanaerobaculia bacterium]|nr:Arc family DNA-binding protein [Thermoanaerobaculia bacterium]
MATLNIKNFPEPLYDKLQERARKEHRSVAQEVVHLLDRVLEQEAPRSILELRGLGKELWEGIDAAEYIRRERDSWDS